MSKLSELIRSLPKEDSMERERIRRTFIDQFLHTPAQTVPRSTGQRLWTMGALQATIGVSYLSSWIHGWFENEDEKKQRRMATHLQSALRVLEKMGYMRGALMKLGQLLASYPGIVPEEFVSTLEHLHFQAPAMHFSLLRATFAAELEAQPEEIFESFETKAFAAASLGQVHRARLKTGEWVAVKIQYPGIAEAIRADFQALVPLLFPSRLSPHWESLKTQIAALRKSILEESDYDREADSIEKARRLFKEEEGIVIPQVYREFSTSKILTLEYLEGKHLPEFLEGEPSEKLKREFADKICRFNFRLFLSERLLYTDTSPGNFIFLPEGKLGVIDFGCMSAYTDAEWLLYQNLATAMLNEDWKNCVATMKKYFSPEGKNQQFDPTFEALIERITHWNCDPLMAKGRFDFSGREHLKVGIENIFQIVRSRHIGGETCNIVSTRLHYGNASLFYRLGAEVAISKIFREEIGLAVKKGKIHV